MKALRAAAAPVGEGEEDEAAAAAAAAAACCTAFALSRASSMSSEDEGGAPSAVEVGIGGWGISKEGNGEEAAEARPCCFRDLGNGGNVGLDELAFWGISLPIFIIVFSATSVSGGVTNRQSRVSSSSTTYGYGRIRRLRLE